jgi:hypothetical protein
MRKRNITKKVCFQPEFLFSVCERSCDHCERIGSFVNRVYAQCFNEQLDSRNRKGEKRKIKLKTYVAVTFSMNF